MKIAASLLVLPALLSLASAERAGAQSDTRRLLVQEQVILRVPVRPRLLPPAVEWVEKKGPKCLQASAIRGAMLSGPQQVDFLLQHRQRVRAKFDDDCPALDFYGGFYLKPEDEEICAKRDSVHSRIGGSCRIERFRELEPKLRDHGDSR